MEIPISYQNSNIGKFQIALSKDKIQLNTLIHSAVAVFLILVMILTILTTNIFLSRKYLFRPLLKLEQSSKTIARGNLNAFIDISSDDEIGALANSFSKMMESIKSITASRDSLNKEITERKLAQKALLESEEKYRDLYNNAPDLFVTVDAQTGIITSCNNALLEKLGIDKNNVIGIDLLDIYAPESIDKAKEQFSNYNKTRENVHDSLFLKKEDGAVIPVSLNISVSKETNGEISYYQYIFRDISKQKELERTILHLQKIESIGTLAAGVAHEINTPIQYVGDNIHFIKDGFKDLIDFINYYSGIFQKFKENGTDKEYLKEIESKIDEFEIEYLVQEIPEAITQAIEGVDRVSKIVKSMKEFAYSGGEEFVLTDINSSIESTVTVTRNEWKYVVDMTLDLDKNIPHISCNRNEINQVILNMIINSSHSISDKISGSNEKGNIKIETKEIDNFIEISISDSGKGIPKDVQDRIFDPFFTTKEIGKGSGQGLAISHSIIVDKHKGKIDFKTSEEGTDFIISLPK